MRSAEPDFNAEENGSSSPPDLADATMAGDAVLLAEKEKPPHVSRVGGCASTPTQQADKCFKRGAAGVREAFCGSI
jgi:hypothetical protein